MKLELKHITPYLPYGLKFEVKQCDEHAGEILTHIDTITGIGVIDDIISFNKSGDYSLTELDLNDFNVKPILRPLREALYDDILNDFKCECLAEREFVRDLEDDVASAGDKVKFAPYSVIQFLVENKIDIFELIENNLAIDINTLNK